MTLMAGGVVLAAGGGAGLWWRERRRAAWRASATPPRPPTPVGAITQIAEQLYLVPGGGGNAAVFVMARGVLVVDTKSPGRGQALLDEVRKVTDKPVTHVVNTHSHDDHSGGNAVMAATAEIITQERTAENLARMRRNQGVAEPARPPRTFRDRLTLFDGAETVDLYYFGPAHTNGDTFVAFRQAGVMHAGDTFVDKTAPIINLPWGGDPATYGETLARAAAEIRNVTQVITGHGPVRPWSDFVVYGEFIRLIVAHARAAMAAGKDANQARRELVLPPKFADYELDRLTSTFHDIYKGLTPWWHVW